MKKIYSIFMAAVTILSFQSCLHDNDEIFEESAAVRLEKEATADKELLESAANGWRMTYYTGEDYTGGGVVFLMKFKNGKAHVSGDIADSDMVTTSSYNIVNDKGPVLTFDTYNVIMHYLAQPYQDDVEGAQGDYEFIIKKKNQDTIWVEGKKWHNQMMMVRMPDDVKWTDYLNSLSKISEDIFAVYDVYENGQVKGSATIDGDERRAHIEYGDQMIDCPFVFTPSGVSLLDPLTVNGKEIRDLDWNSETNSFVMTAENSVSLKAFLDKDYSNFDEFAGTYKFTFARGTVTVELEPDKANKQYLIKGLNPNYAIVAKYIKSKGYLNITSQKVADVDAVQIWFCGWSSATGYFSWSTDCGMYIYKDAENDGTFLFKTNDYVDTEADSFLLWQFNGAPSSNTSAGNAGAQADYLIFGSYQLARPVKLVKVN